MRADKSYCVNHDVVFQVIDNEAVIVDVKTGRYYSTDGLGAVLWSLLAGGLPPADAAAALQGKYGAALGDSVAARLEEFGDQLLAERLLREAPQEGCRGELSLPDLPPPLLAAAPVLHKYSDLENVLALDPIHDVDERGWPNRRSDQG